VRAVPGAFVGAELVLTNEYGTLGIALAITFWILANRER
jgi:hypothetical protein